MSPEGGCAARWSAWEGLEAEGRLLGTPTLFLGRLAAPGDVLADLQRVIGRHYSHIYCNPETIEDGGWDFIRAVSGIAAITTLAVRPDQYVEIPDDLFALCHVVLIVPVARRPKPTDEVRLDLGPYHVLLAPAWTFLETHPDDYGGDRGLVPRGGG